MARRLDKIRLRLADYHQADYFDPARDYEEKFDDIEWLLKEVDKLNEHCFMWKWKYDLLANLNGEAI